eukprot:CAMPEP_0206149676 /NCGR_PEP_ID=MMETSP1473-20131121/37907_1 /ASSEMBLY_ACC=CAM_ASM_001109 /TAXON_ID=1461547 /ORGANISM="Stichococcus sp, Strain RCC1054" /LENGTH=1805 /DNA_ID=CAMNT_0053547157 /DNA_START=182 /DNA_END=5600 /DNA_ORIENTATION=-
MKLLLVLALCAAGASAFSAPNGLALGMVRRAPQQTVLADYKPPSDADLQKICPNALKFNDPSCKNGGRLHADNSTHEEPERYNNCVQCDCPPQWTGIDCSLCKSADACPLWHDPDSGASIAATGCSSDRLLPTAFELLHGKRLTCACGGAAGDKTTAWACNQQPFTHWDATVTHPNGTDKPASLSLIERAGMPSQDDHPGNCPGPGGKGTVPCPTAQRYKYAHPVVWEGTFTGCSWATGDCISPLKGDDCVTLSCDSANVVCPPNYVEKCPGYTITSCGKIPGEGSASYWMHRCNPLAVPKNGSAIKIACEPQRDNETNAFQCYIAQEHSFMASLGMQCTTGGCIYDKAGPAPPMPPVPHHHKTNLVELLALGFIALAIVSVVAISGMLILADTRKSAAQVAHWSAGGMGEPLVLEAIAEADASRPATAAAKVALLPLGGPSGRRAPVVLSWSRVSCSVRKGRRGRRKRILRAVSGVAGMPGGGGAVSCMTAILGPSGAGKTTLLDVLAGRRGGRSVAGVICLNGHPVTPAQVRERVGYVYQDDVLPGTSTVWEFLSFHAALRLPLLNKQAQGERVWQVVQQLGLEKVAHSFIGDEWVRGLSGGERRRVSIAAELLTAPGLLLLDEPTTGLDSSNAAKVVDILAALAEGGVGVVLTIHQPRPDVFRLMHRVLLLSGRGQVVYAGATAQAGPHFARLGYAPASPDISVADHMLDVAIKSPPEEVEQLAMDFSGSRVSADDQAWAATLQAQPWPLPPRRRAPAFALNFAAAAATAAGLAVTFYATGYETGGIQSRLGVLFYMVLYLSMMALGSLPVWRQDGILFARERDAGVYTTNAYFLATAAFDLGPMRVAPPAFFAVLSYWAIGLHAGCATCVLCFLGILIWSNIAAATMAMMIGAACPSDASANTAGSLAIMASLLFGGFMLNKDQVPSYASWAAAASYFNYAYEALAINEFHQAPTPFFFTSPLNSSVLPTLRVSGEGVLKEFGFHSHRFWGDVVAVALCSVVFAAVTYLLLQLSDPTVMDRIKRLSLRRRSKEALHSPRGAEQALLPMASADADAAEAEAAEALEEYQEGEEGLGSGEALDAAKSRSSGDVKGYEHDDDDDMTLQEALSAGLSLGLSDGGAVGPALSELHTAVAIDGGEVTAGEEHGTAFVNFSNGNPDGHRGGLVLTWEDVSYSVRVGGAPQPRRILTDISGIAGDPLNAPTGPGDSPSAVGGAGQHPPSRTGGGGGGGGCGGGGGMCAILGPSGAGKTTLLDILAGRRWGAGVLGNIRLSGRRVSPAEVRGASGYVHQDDVLPGTSTVWEFLAFHAALRLPEGHDPAAAGARVRLILRQLSLAKVAFSFIGDAYKRGLSGGERRRVSIAAELITAPQLLFLDEATTGLDSTNAAAVVDILAALAGGGTTVVLSVHQPRPDVLAMMRRALILSSHGRVVYSGPMDTARAHFEALGYHTPPEVNIADRVLDLVIRSPSTEVQKLVDGFSRSAVARADAEVLARVTLDGAMQTAEGHVPFLEGRPRASLQRQLAALSGRAAKNARRHPALIAVNWGATAVVAAGLGAVYAGLQRDSGGIQNRLGACAFMVLYLGVLGLSSLPIWRAERLLFIRERASGVYGTAAYFITGVAWDFLPMRVLPTAMFALVTYPMMGLRPGLWYAGRFLGVLVLTNLTGTAMSMAVGAAAPTTAVANTGGSLAVLTAALFGGFLLSRAQMPALTRWLSTLSFVRYGYEALLDNELHGMEDFFFTPYSQKGIPKEKIPSVRVSGDIVLGTFGFVPGSLPGDVACLWLLLAAFLAATFCLLKFRRLP